MKINEDNESFRGVPQHFWGVMTVSDSNELANFTPDYAEACFGVDAGPAFGSLGRLAAAPAAVTASGAAQAAATPAPSFPAVDPAAGTGRRHYLGRAFALRECARLGPCCAGVQYVLSSLAGLAMKLLPRSSSSHKMIEH